MTMELELIRKYRDRDILDGILKMNGRVLCDTSENAYYALKPGRYPIERRYCPQYNQHVPLVRMPVNDGEKDGMRCVCCAACLPLRENNINTPLPGYCPQIKMGNGIHNRRDGSIIIGTRIAPGALKEPALPYGKLTERLRKLASRGTDVTLIIR